MKDPLGQIRNKTLANEVHQVIMINNDDYSYSYSYKWSFSVQSIPAKKIDAGNGTASLFAESLNG